MEGVDLNAGCKTKGVEGMRRVEKIEVIGKIRSKPRKRRSNSSRDKECPVCNARYFRQRTYLEGSRVRRVFAHWNVRGNIKICIDDNGYGQIERRESSKNDCANMVGGEAWAGA